MDLIDRRAVIDELNFCAETLRRVLDDTDLVGFEREKFEWGLVLIESCIFDMKDLPSAQPETIRCKDCMFWRRDRISCEGYAMCQTGEGGIRFRRENDYCSVARRRTNDREAIPEPGVCFKKTHSG